MCWSQTIQSVIPIRIGSSFLGTVLAAFAASGSSAGIIILAPAFASASEFGWFSVAVTLALFTGVAVNGFFGEGLLTAERSLAQASRDAWAACLLTAVLLSGLAGVVAALSYVGSGEGMLMQICYPLFFCLGPTLTLAFWRTRLMAQRRPLRAAGMDTLFLSTWVLSVVCMRYVFGLELQAADLTAVWGASVVLAVSAVGGIKDLRGSSLKSVLAWIRGNRVVGSQLAGAELSYAAGANVANLIAVASLGPAAVGVLRLAQTIFGLGRVFFVAVRAYILPRLAMRRSDELRVCVQASAGLALVPAISLGAVSILLPHLESVWSTVTVEGVKELSVPVACGVLGAAVGQGAVLGLRTRRWPGRMLFARLSSAGLLVATAWILLQHGYGAVGLAWAWSCVEFAGACLLWFFYLQGRRATGPHA